MPLSSSSFSPSARPEARSSPRAAKLLCICLRSHFICLLAQCMTELMCDGEDPELVQRHPPRFEELAAARRPGIEQRFFQKDLPFLEDGECRTFGVATDAPQDRLPVLGPDENPRPVTERRQIHPDQYAAQLVHLPRAIRLVVAGVADEVKGWRRDGRGLPGFDEEQRRDKDTQLTAHEAPPRIRVVPPCSAGIAISMTAR